MALSMPETRMSVLVIFSEPLMNVSAPVATSRSMEPLRAELDAPRTRGTSVLVNV